MCSICHVEEIMNKTTLTCGHIFCTECISQWRSITCPNCRAPTNIHNTKDLFRNAIQFEDVNELRHLLQFYIPPYDILYFACVVVNYTSEIIIKILIEDGRCDFQWAIHYVAIMNYTEMMRIILLNPNTNITVFNYIAFRHACYKGHTEIVKMLMNDPRHISRYNNYCLNCASENGYTEIVRLLLPVSDPTNNLCESIKSARKNGHTEIVNLLSSSITIRKSSRIK